MNSRSRGLLALLCLASTTAARAGTLYVIGQLVIGVTTMPDGSGDRVATIHSGDSVELMDRQEEYDHVRLPSGADGWVKASYLSADTPLQLQLSQRNAEADRLREDVARLQQELKDARAAGVAAKSAVAGPTLAPAAPTDPPASLAAREDLPVPLLGQSAEPARPVWQWIVATAVLALVGGFILGWRMLDRRIRRKYGGLRIY